MQACQSSLEDMKIAAKSTYQDLLERIDQFETWSIENVNAIMAMENMPLENEDRGRILECLEGKVSFQEAVDGLVNKYTRK